VASMNSPERHGQALLDQIRRLPTAVLSDALDRLNLPGSAHGLSPLRAGQPLAEARTVTTSCNAAATPDPRRLAGLAQSYARAWRAKSSA
jgi:hypothetical protein